MFNKFGNLTLSLHLSFSCNQEERIKKVPHISNLHYRFKRIDKKVMEELLEYVRREVEKR